MMRADFRTLVNRLFDYFGDSGEGMSAHLIALTMLKDGTNPQVIINGLPWWDTDHFVWLMNRSKKQKKRTPKEEYVKPDDAS